MTTVQSTEGETRTFDFTLSLDAAAFNLTGLTPVLELTARDGTTVNITTGVSITVAVAGTVAWSPANAAILTFANSPYKFRFRVDDGSGLRHYFPNQGANRWIVYKP